MKTGNVILAIFLWLCIPAVLVLGAMSFAFASYGGASATEGVICMIGAPLILFILGLMILIKGMDKPKHITLKHEERFCPKCGRIIPLDAKMCPYCGNDFQIKMERKEGKSRKTKFCVQCGASLEGASKFCKQCGTELR